MKNQAAIVRLKYRVTILLLGLVIVSGIFFVFRKFQLKNKMYVAPPVSEVVPDYSGIQVKDVVTKDLKSGEGLHVINKSKVNISYQAWIYAPAEIGNKGKLILAKNDHQNIFLDIGDSKTPSFFKRGLLGMKKGGIRQLIVPNQQASEIKGFDGAVPPKAIVLFEVELNNVE